MIDSPSVAILSYIYSPRLKDLCLKQKYYTCKTLKHGLTSNQALRTTNVVNIRDAPILLPALASV